MTTVWCPHCSACYSISDECQGRRVKCKECDQIFHLGKSPSLVPPPPIPPKRKRKKVPGWLWLLLCFPFLFLFLVGGILYFTVSLDRALTTPVPRPAPTPPIPGKATSFQEKPPRISPSRPTPKSDMTLLEFQTNKPNHPVRLVVVCSLQDYYNFSYRGCSRSHYSIFLKNGVDTVNGWVKRDSEAGRKLYEILKDGRSQQFFLEISYSNPDGSPSDEVVTIHQVVKY